MQVTTGRLIRLANGLDGCLVAASLAFALAAFPLSLPAQDARNSAAAIAGKAEKAVRARHYGEAIEGFRRAWELSREPEYLYNIALIYLERIQDPLNAWEYSEKYAFAARTDEERREAADLVRKAEAALSRRHGKITIRTEPTSAEVFVDGVTTSGRTVRSEFWVAAGPHIVRATAPGFDPAESRVEVEAGGSTDVSLVLTQRAVPPRIDETPLALAAPVQVKPDVEPPGVRVPAQVPPPDAQRPLGEDHTAAWATIGCGLAAVATGTLLWGLGYQDIVTANGMDSGAPRDTKIDDGRRKAIAGYVLWGVGGAAVVAGVIVYFTVGPSGGAAIVPSGPGGPGITAVARF
jgi:hypothetical protein